MLRSSRGVLVALALPIVVGCKSSPTHEGPPPPFPDAATTSDASTHDASTHPHDATMPKFDARALVDGNLPDVQRGEPPPPPKASFCELPGSVVWSEGLPKVVHGGGSSEPDLRWLKVPDGFCVHYFATVPETRLLRFSPSGDLFVASPGTAAAGGAAPGLSAVVVLPDDDHDGVADSTLKYLTGLPITHGLLFTNGYLYYQNGTSFFRTPYKNGDRVAKGPGEQVIDINVYTSSLHFSKAIDADDDGNIYVTNGGDEGDSCSGAALTTSPPFHGGVLRIDGSPNGELIARGLRNPIALRCAKGTGTCFGLELARDFVPEYGSREKLFPVHKGDNWGFPCCATAGTPYSDYTNPVPDCSTVAPEEDSFIIDHTPFGLDFEEGSWQGVYQYRAFVALHGVFPTWAGARVLTIATDPQSGWPMSAAEANEEDAGGAVIMDFATGWDDGQHDHGRPAAVAFAPDGRLFVGDDMAGLIVWIAPVGAGK